MTSGVPTRDGEALSLDTLSITDTQRYVERGYPWAEWDLLRREAPVYWYDRPDVDPFWALTTYEDTLTISKRSDIFISSDRLRIFPRTQEEFSRRRKEELIARFGPERARRHYTLSFIDMDDPEHAAYRNLTNRSFTPRAMRLLEDHIAELAEAYVSGFARHLVNTVAEQGECDFVHDLAVKLPMAAIFEMLGFPREDWEELFGIREVQFGSDRELALSGLTDEELHEERQKANKAATEYGFAFIEARKAAGAPSDRLVDVLLRAELDGRTLEDDEINSYINLLVAGRAGDDAERHDRRGARPDGAPRGARQARRQPGAAAHGRRGDPALDLARDSVRAGGHRGLRAAWPHHPRGRDGGDVVPLGESRRGGLGRPLPL